MAVSYVWKLVVFFISVLCHPCDQNIYRNFLARVMDGSLEPYATKEEVKKDESSQDDEEVKKEEVKDEL